MLDLIIELSVLLEREGIVHGFGGAIALSFYADPRNTINVDLNVATTSDDAPSLLAVLGAVGFSLAGNPDATLPIAGLRMIRGYDTLDVFLSYDSFHQRVLERRKMVVLFKGAKEQPIEIISPNDLVVFKLSFNRGKDWVDIEAMVQHGTILDVALISEELLSLRGPTMYPRLARLKALLEELPK